MDELSMINARIEQLRKELTELYRRKDELIIQRKIDTRYEEMGGK